MRSQRHPLISCRSPQLPGSVVLELPCEILLEIFDAYRRTFLPDRNSSYERDWNSSNGWFRLAHVCRGWRQIVLMSSSRLRLRLFFTPQRTGKAVAIRRLSPLPIIVDYTGGARTVNEQKRIVSALAYSDRVRQIFFIGAGRGLEKLLEAMNRPFPALVAFHLHATSHDPYVLPPAFLVSFAPSLQHLVLCGITLASALPLLSNITTLVGLHLEIDTVYCPSSGTSLLTHLQHMPHLRHLRVDVQPFLRAPAEGPNSIMENDALLVGVTQLRVSGFTPQIEKLVDGLNTPSLQELQITLFDPDFQFPGGISHIYSLIHNAGIVFSAAQIQLLYSMTVVSLVTDSHSLDDPPFRIIVYNNPSTATISNALSAMLATVEDVYLTAPFIHMFPLGNFVRWRNVFTHFLNVKTLRMHHGQAKEVISMFRQDSEDGPPATDLSLAEEAAESNATIPSGLPVIERPFDLDILPSLEVVHVLPAGLAFRGGTCPSSLASFESFKAARRRGGRPVEVVLEKGSVLPRYFHCSNYNAKIGLSLPDEFLLRR